MDELVHHCLRELSFDGDLGTWVLCTDLITVFSVLGAYFWRTGHEEDRSNPDHDNS